MMHVHSFVLALLAACTIAADPCDTTLAPTPAPTPSPTPAPTPATTPAPTPAPPSNPCDTTAAPAPSPAPTPAPAPSPAPTPGCSDKPGDWKSSAGATCADYVSKAYCTADGGYGSGWDDSSTFDDWAVNGVAATVACCGCGGG